MFPVIYHEYLHSCGRFLSGFLKREKGKVSTELLTSRSNRRPPLRQPSPLSGLNRACDFSVLPKIMV